MTATREDVGVWSCPDSQLILPVTASRQEWLVARRAGIGGSDLGALMGVSPYTNPYQVWRSKRGDVVDIQTVRMQRGTRFEAVIAEEAAELLGFTTRRVGLHRSRQYPHLIGSVDRAASDGGGLEIKWVQNYHTAKKLLASVKDPEVPDLFPPHWLYQQLSYLALTGRTHWWLAALLPGIDDLYVRRFDAIEYATEIAAIGPAIEAWWQIHMDGDVAPNEGRPFVPGELKAGKRVEAADPEQALRDQARLIELQEDGGAGELEIVEIKKRLQAQMGDGMELSVAGRVIAKFNPRAGVNRFLRKKFKAEHPEMEKEYSEQGEPGGFISAVR